MRTGGYPAALLKVERNSEALADLLALNSAQQEPRHDPREDGPCGFSAFSHPSKPRPGGRRQWKPSCRLPALHGHRRLLVCAAEKLLSKWISMSHGLDAPRWPPGAPQACLSYLQRGPQCPSRSATSQGTEWEVPSEDPRDRKNGGWCPAVGAEQQAERLMGASWSQKGCGDPLGEPALPP